MSGTSRLRTRYISRATLWIGVTLAIVSVTFAQSSNVDWKYYGGAPLDEKMTLCFYDAEGITHKTDDHIRVWTKCLQQTEVEGVDIKKEFGGAILENTARKLANYYVPPIAIIETINLDEILTITQYEETADISDIQPRASIFYELNCPERMMQELSISIQAGGKGGFLGKPSDWRHVPPEGNGAQLLRILCP